MGIYGCSPIGKVGDRPPRKTPPPPPPTMRVDEEVDPILARTHPHTETITGFSGTERDKPATYPQTDAERRMGLPPIPVKRAVASATAPALAALTDGMRRALPALAALDRGDPFLPSPNTPPEYDRIAGYGAPFLPDDGDPTGPIPGRPGQSFSYFDYALSLRLALLMVLAVAAACTVSLAIVGRIEPFTAIVGCCLVVVWAIFGVWR